MLSVWRSSWSQDLLRYDAVNSRDEIGVEIANCTAWNRIPGSEYCFDELVKSTWQTFSMNQFVDTVLQNRLNILNEIQFRAEGGPGE